MKVGVNKAIYGAMAILILSGCSSMRSWFAIQESDRSKPISNPFAAYQAGSKEANQTMILRTKKGDRSVEIELPGGTSHLSDFVLPVSPAFKDSTRSPASNDPTGTKESTEIDDSLRSRPPSMSDHEILRTLNQGQAEDQAKRTEIEKSLNLAPTEDFLPQEGATSYLASLDRIKQLYRRGRFEAALLETDDMIRLYQTDPKLHEMRGTLLDRLGRRKLAIDAWNQALRFNPKNEGLRRFIERKQVQITGLP